MPYRRPIHPIWTKAYYRSEEWAERKSEYYKAHPRRCTACFRRGRDIQLHHKIYRGIVNGIVIILERRENWGKEPDEWLTPLCGSCHRNVHAVDNCGKFETLEQATDWYIARTNRRRARHRRYEKIPLIGWLWH